MKQIGRKKENGMQPNEHPDFADIIDMELDCTEYDLKGATEEQPILPGVLDGTTV